MSEMELEVLSKKRAQEWLGEKFDIETRKEVKRILESEKPDDQKQLIDSFYKDIDFGTGGVRGLMGVGCNRINRYTLSKVTQGLIRFFSKNFSSEKFKVAIAYDTRNYSEVFSQEVAEIFAQFGAEVYRFQQAMPTPLLSYAVRKLDCRIGVVITASHNPKEYNGYKVYFEDGGQIVPPWDKLIIDEVNQVTDFFTETPDSTERGKMMTIGEDVLTSYTEDIMELIQFLPKEIDTDLKIVFSAIHGTGGKLIVPFLSDLGFSQICTVPSQMVEDGNFPTVVYPNPEEKEALALGLKMMEEKGADLLMATDPDADRLGVAVRDANGNSLILNGNQIGVLLSDYILSAHRNKGKGMSTNFFLVRTIVTTPLIDLIAEENGLDLFQVLTGFKYIGEMIRKYEGNKKFLFGLEESHGYLATDKVRDKDAVSSALLFAVMAAHYQKEGKSVYFRLCEIYEKFGFYFETLESLTKKGPEGKQEIDKMISQLRQRYSEGKNEIASEKLRYYRDYASGYEIDFFNKKKTKIDLPSSDVIQLQTEKNTLITVRPSGTEPKVKFYFSVRFPLSSSGDVFSKVDGAKRTAIEKIEDLKKIFIPS